MLTTYKNLSLELLTNGLVRVEDARCAWVACYRMIDGTYAHGGVDAPAYREAVAALRNGLLQLH